MNQLRTFALLLILLPAPSRALELRHAGELRAGSGGFTEWLDPRGYVRLENEWERAPGGGLGAVTFVVADVREQKLLRLRFALDAFHRSHPSLFTGPPNVELVYFDGTLGLLRFDRREPSRTISYYSVWNPRTQTLSEPAELGGAALATAGGKLRATRVVYLVGADPGASRLYFADATLDDRTAVNPGPVALGLFRVTFPALEVDWALDLQVPRRTPRQLPLERHRVFSPDGKKLAIAEYHDAASQRRFRPDPPPRVYVIDLERKKVAHYPIPRTPYGLSFSRDGRYLAVGSHEEEVIVRIDLAAGRIDRRVKAQPHIQAFASTPSGASLLVLSDHLGAPRSIEVRRWSDLGLEETIPISRLFPGVAGIHPEGVRATSDGRWLVTPRYAKDGYPDRSDAGLVTFALDEAAARPRAPRADPVALVRRHVERTRLKLYSYQVDRIGNDEGWFAPVVATEAGGALVIGTTSELPQDAPYAPGKSHPYAIRVDAKGDVLWQRSLRSGTVFSDYQGASAVPTPDGGFIAMILCYLEPPGGAAGRMVKLDRAGRVEWEWTSAIGRSSRFPESARLLPSGRVLVTGHVGTSRTSWTGELDARTGKLVRDDVGAPR